MTDIEIAHAASMLPIGDVAKKIGISSDGLEPYGTYKAKLTPALLASLQNKAANPASRGRLILVTAVTPTPAGEGKSTVTIALGDAINRLGKRCVIALREPSLGPCFGVKGGACGGGHAQIVPMEDINLHFTGDIHAVSVANNLIAALIDNHIQQGNALGLDPKAIYWKRCVDLNDRVLRSVIVGLGSKVDGVMREEHFSISAASEIMAIICLSKNIHDLKERLNNIVIGQNSNKEFVKFGSLGCTGAVAALLKDAIRPNLVQTLEKSAALVHGGPFANIAHGCNSINATLCALALGDVAVTEAGFGADLGAEKFFDIKCRAAGIAPDAVVIVATVRALKMHGGVAGTALSEENLDALRSGFANLLLHAENIKKFGVPAIVAINRFTTDTGPELALLQNLCAEHGIDSALCEGWEKGGAGAEDLARRVLNLSGTQSHFKPIYELSSSIEDKVRTLAREIYRAGDVVFEEKALRKIRLFEKAGYGSLPVCVAKTQNSVSHDKHLPGAPSGYTFPIKDARLFSGAGFVTVFAGDIVDMPGLPKIPAAARIDVDDNGVISGLS